jgi:hypothetical protein
MKYNTPGREGKNIIAHFGVAATCLPWPGTSSCMPATGDDHVVRLQINFPGKAEIAVKLCIYYCFEMKSLLVIKIAFD